MIRGREEFDVTSYVAGSIYYGRSSNSSRGAVVRRTA